MGMDKTEEVLFMLGKGMEIFLKGMWIGGTMTVPGISGGSMAMVMGIYERLILAVSTFFKKPGENGAFLLRFLAGAAVGMVLFSRLIGWLFTTRVNVPLRYFFLGAVAGGIPMIFREAGIRRMDMESVVYIGVGILTVLLLALVPTGLFVPGKEGGTEYFLLQAAGGLLIAAGLVLPGISVSQMLLMMGLYETVIGSVGRLDFLPLIPMGIGAAAGTFLTASLLESLFERYPKPASLVILGFMLGSLPELFPGIPQGKSLFFSIGAAAAGFAFLAFFAGRRQSF